MPTCSQASAAQGGSEACSPLELIFSQRSFLMGLAMVAIMLFHESFVSNDFLLLFQSCGHYGVDVFFFLSGMGIACSLRKNDTRTFYINRLWRLLPAWLAVAVLAYAVDCGGEFSLFRFLWWAGHWWFLRTLVIYYLLSPLFARYLARMGFAGVLLVLGGALAYFALRTWFGFSISPLELSNSVTSTLGRLPAYLMGIYVIVGNKGSVERVLRAGWLSLAGLVLLVAVRMWMMCGWAFPFKAGWWHIHYLEPMIYPLVGMVVPAVCVLVARVGNGLRRSRIPALLGLFGVVSLELYLWHEWWYRHVGLWAEGWLALAAGFAGSLLLAWATHWLCARAVVALRGRAGRRA